MSQRHRILVFGVTGIDKRRLLDKFAVWSAQRFSLFRVLDFENESLLNSKAMRRPAFQILDAPQQEQRDLWKKAWGLFQTRLTAEEKAYPDHDIIISLHGSVVRGHYGVRCIAQLSDLIALKPSRVVTLIDNIYDMWWRTRERAGPETRKGKPTFEQLITARRCETIVADLVAYGDGSNPIDNLLLAVRHPYESLWNWLQSETPKVVYLSFPISAPRRLEGKGDLSGIAEINGFVELAHKHQLLIAGMVLLCPLTIDELPLKRIIESYPLVQDEDHDININITE